jgi:hypothetical protein
VKVAAAGKPGLPALGGAQALYCLSGELPVSSVSLGALLIAEMLLDV